MDGPSTQFLVIRLGKYILFEAKALKDFLTSSQTVGAS